MMHCSSDQLQSYLDRVLNAEETRVVEEHLHVCVDCTSAYKVLAGIDSSLKTVRREAAPVGLTEFVMSKVNNSSRSSVWYKMLGGLGYFLSLLFVLGVMVSVFLITGVLGSDQVSETQSVVGTAFSHAGGAVTEVLTSFAGTFRQLFPFMFVKGSFGLMMFGAFVALILGAVDRVVRGRFVHRG